MTLVNSPTQLSIVDILSDAYAKLNRAPWVLLIPLLLNAYLWFGTGVSLAPLVTQMQALVQELQSDGTSEMNEMRDQSLGLLAQLSQADMRGQVAWLNVVPYTIYSFRAAGVSADALGLPYIVALPAPPVDTNAATVSDGALLLQWILVINVVSLLASALFLDGVRSVVTGHVAWAHFVGRWARTVAILLLYALLVMAVVALLLIPLSIFTVLLFGASPALGAFFVFIGAGAWLWASVYIGFTREIMVLAQVGPIQGIRMSVQLVRANFWRTLGLLMMLLVIAAGSGVIFEGLMVSFSGRVAAIVVSAYLMTGLVVARMRFVQHHLQQDVSTMKYTQTSS